MKIKMKTDNIFEINNMSITMTNISQKWLKQLQRMKSIV